MTANSDGVARADFRAQGRELHRDYLSLLLGVVSAFCALAVMRAAAWKEAPALFFTWPIALTLGAGLLLASILRKRSERLAVWVFLLTLIAANVMEVVYFPHGPALFLFSLIGVMAALLLSERGAIVASLIIFAGMGLAGWLVRNEIGLSEFLAPAIIAALIIFVSWLGTRQLYTVLQWEWHSTQQALTAMKEAQDHRAELSQLNKELDGAYQRLERMNHMLVLARKEAEDATALKVQFANAVSHELRSPINMIVGFSDMMVNSPEVYGRKPWPPRLKQHIVQIYQSSQHLSQLIDDVLDLARIDAYRLALAKAPAQIADVIDEAVEIVRSLFDARGLSLRVEVESGLPAVSLDRTRIRQVLLNLLTNATRFTQEGGVVVRAVRKDQEVVVSVSDSGIGIAPEDMPKLFQVFCQLEGAYHWGRGSGLGLSISKQLVELHAGRIWAESEPGKGATFLFTLPLDGAPAISPQAHSAGDDAFWRRLEQKARSHRPVLAWDEEPAVHRLLASHLRDYDIMWLQPQAGDENKIDIEQHLTQVAQDDSPFAIIRLSGDATAAPLPPVGLLSRLPDVAFISGVLPGLARKPAYSGLSDYLIKPVTRHRLADALAKVSERAGQIRRVVIVEDEAPMREFLRLSTLTILGGRCEIFDTDCGLEALRLVERHQPDVVMLDLNLPDIDGLDLAARIHAEHVGVATIAITARDFGADDHRDTPDVLCCARMKRFNQREIEGLLNAMLGSLNAGADKQMLS